MGEIVADTDETHGGGCLCGRVRYRIHGPLRGVIACHCSQCRRTSGHYAAMTSAPSKSIVMTCSDSLVWSISITAGTLDLPTNIAMERHIFVADKSDYYSIDDDLPQQPGW